MVLVLRIDTAAHGLRCLYSAMRTVWYFLIADPPVLRRLLSPKYGADRTEWNECGTSAMKIKLS